MAILAGVGDHEGPIPKRYVLVSVGGATGATNSASTSIVKLQAARQNIQNLWNRAWTLKDISFKQAFLAVQTRNRPLYDTANTNDAEAERWMRRAAELGAENDDLRSRLYDEIRDEINLDDAQTRWFTQKAGFQPPALYDSRVGGTPIPRFPVWA